MSEETFLQQEKDQLRARLCKYTRKAYQILPKLDKPRILDIGCGSGVPTMELARLSQGEIVGIDIDQLSLDRFARKIELAGLSHRVKIVKCSMVDMELPEESFDIIWAEGSIATIGFKEGLKKWKKFLKSNGLLVIHDGTENITQKLDQITICGYELIDYFILPDDAWWADYYRPLEMKIEELRAKHTNDPQALLILDREQKEIDMYKKNPNQYGSAFFIMQKK